MIKPYIAKVEKLFEIGQCFGRKINLSRKKFMTSFVLSMCISRSVQFNKIATFLNEDASDASNLRRIQRFFKDYELSYVQFAVLMISFIPNKRYRLCIDRTNWQFGNTDINVFALTVYYKGTSIPILFQMLDKRGNSNQEERIDLLGKFLSLFGGKCIKSLTADREFIGKKWIKYLVKKKIDFQIRIPKSHFVQIGELEKKGGELLEIYGKRFLKNIKYQKMDLHLAMDFSKNAKGEDDPLLIITNNKNCDALKIYKERWSIEVFFQSIKKRGFDLEDTHLDKMDRIAKLFMFTGIAFVICLVIGIYKDANEKEIPIKNHGYKSNSYFRHGLDALKEALARPNKMKDRLNEFVDLVTGFAQSVFENNVRKFVKIRLKKIVV